MWEAGEVLECKASPSSSTVLIVASESWGEGSLFGAGISVNNNDDNHIIHINQGTKHGAEITLQDNGKGEKALWPKIVCI